MKLESGICALLYEHQLSNDRSSSFTYMPWVSSESYASIPERLCYPMPIDNASLAVISSEPMLLANMLRRDAHDHQRCPLIRKGQLPAANSKAKMVPLPHPCSDMNVSQIDLEHGPLARH